MTPPPTHLKEDVVPSEHLADERLVDLALNDTALAHEREHLSSCGVCRAALASLSRTVDVTREAAAVQLIAPGPEVWSRIAADLDDPGAAEPISVPDDERVPAALGTESTPGVAVLSVPAEGSTSPEVVVPLRHRHRRVTPGHGRPALGWLAAACAAGILVGAGGFVAADRLREPATPVSRTVATAELDTLDTAQPRGTATVSERADAVMLEVSARDLRPAGDGYVEVWLINRDLTRMVSVGVLDEGLADQAFPISRRLLDEGYVIVDLSREEFDDKPQHSGDSLVRGSLTTRA